MLRTTLVIALIGLLISCQKEESTGTLQVDALQTIPSPSQYGAQGRLFSTPSAEVLLSWTAFLNDSTDALQFAQLEGNQWSTPTTIATGTNWFTNWADFPALAVYPDSDQNMIAHWLQMRAEGTYDYDIYLSQSNDGGQSWEAPFIPHRDSIAAEHGFVSMLPLSEDRIFLSWLDGRNTKGGQGSHDDHGHASDKAMTLRAAEVAPDGQIWAEAELDARVCDCCQTSAALTALGPIVAYRDRSQEEIRDISVVRQVDGKWLPAQTVHNDQWKIAGCPVNGPSIQARGERVAIAWFTAPDNDGQVKLAWSNDNGANFGAPIRIDRGNPLGRVAVAFIDDQTVAVSWMEQAGQVGEIRLVTVDIEGTKGEEAMIAQTEASRQSGFPVMTTTNDALYLAWTAVDSSTQVQTVMIPIKHY